MPRILWTALVVFFIGAGACQKSSTDREQAKATNPKVEGRLPEEPPTVMFEYGNYLLGQLARVL